MNLHIPNTPAITYRRTCSLKDQLVRSDYVGTFRSNPCKRLGTFTCGGCSFSRYMNTQPNTILPNGKLYKPKHYANCKTVGIVYLLTCQCQCFYVGKKQILEKGCQARHLPLGRHVRDCHQSRSPCVHFTILDQVHPDNRGGDWNKLLLQCAVRWIAELNATLPPGLNTQLSYHLFVDGFASGGCEEE